ncbi:MAG: ubiquinol-cytochrome c reductase iron-sulfur subunit [Chloroflexi bacterium]|nr:ubiquinol-cytochrome c reductase iron-sulfur subunit [Chloroflexota bacterium]
MESETQEPQGGDTGGQPQSAAPQQAQPSVAAEQPVAATIDTPVATPVPKRPVFTRRLFILGGFWTTMSLALVGLVGPSLNFAFTRNPSGGAREVFVSADRIPAPGDDPVVIAEGRFFLVNLEAGVTPNREETEGGLLALWQKCPHLGCTVPYRSDFNFLGRTGWFRCPCHGSTYTKEGGILVAGPAPRPMDRFVIEVQEDNSIVVNTGVTVAETGAADNPSKTVEYNA